MLNNLYIVLPLLTPQAPISHFKTYGGYEFIKMKQKNNMYNFLLVLGGGQDKPAWTACPPGGEDNQGGGKIPRDSLTLGASSLGGKIN